MTKHSSADALAPFTLIVTEVDIEKAAWPCEKSCAGMQAYSRQLNPPSLDGCFIGVDISVFALPDDNGDWIRRRFLNRGDTKAKIEGLQDYQIMTEGPLYFVPPVGVRTLTGIARLKADMAVRRALGTLKKYAKRIAPRRTPLMRNGTRAHVCSSPIVAKSKGPVKAYGLKTSAWPRS